MLKRYITGGTVATSYTKLTSQLPRFCRFQSTKSSESTTGTSNNAVITPVDATRVAVSPLKNFDAASRLLPTLPTFYTQNPPHEQNMSELRYMMSKYGGLPKQELHLVERKQWMARGQYALNGGGTRLKSKEYSELVKGLVSLNEIHPQFKNDELLSFLNRFIRKSNILENPKKLKELDHLGRAVARGTRKSSTAKVYVAKGDGQVLVNNQRSLNNYFVKMKDRESIMYPLKVIGQLGAFNVYITCSGGGVTGQAEAAMHALAKALLIFNPLWKTRLFKAKLLTKDYRHVERKKPGKVKARKMPTWVKR